MKIQITYCGEWNYLPQASSLQAAIKQKYGVVADLVEGHSGIFTVEIDGRMAYDNRTTYRFPTDDEIFAEIDAAKG